MTESLVRLLLRLSEGGDPAILWGRQAAPHAGRTFERLLDRGVLVEQAPATEWDVCPACDCGLDTRPIERIDGRIVAVCPTDRRSDVLLDNDDLRSFRTHPPALVREITAASGFRNQPSLVTAGVWYLGETLGQRVLFLVLSRHAVLQPGMIGLMRSVARSLPITVVSPKMNPDDQARFFEAGIAVVSTATCFGADASADGFAVDPATLKGAPAFEARLVIFRQSQRVILDGLERHIPQQPFKLLVMLADAVESRRGYLTLQEIEAANSGRGAADLIRELRGFLSEGQQDRGKALVGTRRSPTRYFLALPPEEFESRP